MNNFTLYDFSGLIGSTLMLVSYFLLQIRKINPDKILYSIINAIGALLVLISLYEDFNLAATILESVWLIVSLIGIVRIFSFKKF